MLSNKDICIFLQAAFLPLRCVTEVWDYDQKLKLKVLDAGDKTLVSIESIVLSSIRDASSLNGLCENVRVGLDVKSSKGTT